MKHHPQGPSRQKNIDICCGFQPTLSEHANKLLGTVCHKIWDTGDRTLADQLSDPDFALWLVDKIQAKWCEVLQDFTTYSGLLKISCNEMLLDAPGINFGTCDRLRIAGKNALIGDGKFGAWKVEHAESNLQGHNYAVLVWELYPEVQDIWVWFGNSFLEDYTLAKFTRRRDYQRFKAALVKRIADAVESNPSKFHFDNLNCSFCSRLECPVRNEKAEEIVQYLQQGEVYGMDNVELARIKKLTNSLKTLTKCVDDEVKRRVLDGGETLPSFVIKERVRSREIVGASNIEILKSALCAAGTGQADALLDYFVSVSFSDVEQLIQESVGNKRQAKATISKVVEELEAARALTTNKYYIVATKNEAEK